jgi:Ca2+-binding EF-hand superfamily protein
MDQPYSVAADGRDVYRCFVLPTNFAADKYLSAFDVVPGNHRVVHHVIAYLDTSGRARQLAAASGGYGYTSFGGPGFPATGALGGWAPGNVPVPLPDGVGILLPKGADIILQVHYHSDGKPETDLTKIGLYFTDKPVDKRLRVMPFVYPMLHIPAGDADYQVDTSYVVPANVTLLQVFPHMHLLGKQMTVNATTPDGTFVPLIKINDWDFNWQTAYNYKQPIKLPLGTRLRLTADYDNSENNPRNPNNPPKPVTWGEQTTDEMCIAFLFYTVDDEHLTQGIVSTMNADSLSDPKQLASYIMQYFDKKQDGKLDLDEVTAIVQYLRAKSRPSTAAPLQSDGVSRVVAARLIKSFDTDGDGTIDVNELAEMIQTLKR